MKTISAKVLQEMLISGANNLFNHYPEIDALNVFPVPDGDTGTNMNLTCASGAKEIQNRNDADVHTIALTFSKGLLMGARGNSGVITSQIFRGFAQSLEGKKTINADALAEAFAKGSEVAYKAVMRPVEGTILTVIRESSSALVNYVKENSDLEKAMKYMVTEAKASLKRTPDLLPVLKEVGVVDSGGAGLCKILEGMLNALVGKFVEKKEISRSQTDNSAQQAIESDEFGYCTEFILRLDPENKKPFIENRFKSVLQNHGNSLVVVHDDDIVKVHVHTLNPGAVLTYGQSFGEFVKIKVENMTEQHTSLQEKKEGEPEPEKTADEKPLEHTPTKDVAMVAVAAGKGIEQAFLDLGVSELITGGQTMNPSIVDIVNAIKKTDAKTVFVFPNNSNIIMAALQAKDVLHEEIEVVVINAKTIPQGIAAVSQFLPDAPVEDNVKNMKEVIAHISSGEITYAVKDTKIDNVQIKKDDYMAIMNKKIVCCESKSDRALTKMLKKMIKEDNYLATIFVGQDVSDKVMKELQKELPETYPNIDFDIRRGDQPVYDYLVGIE